jgi:uncharacterized protein YeeX (DUF496 family)
MVQTIKPTKPLEDMTRSELVEYVSLLRKNNEILSRTVERFEETFVEIQGVTKKVDLLESELQNVRVGKSHAKDQLAEQGQELKELTEDLEIKNLTLHRQDRWRLKALKCVTQVEELIAQTKEFLSTKPE